MKNMIQKMQNQRQSILLQFKNGGPLIVALVKEKKKHFKVHNPMIVEKGHTKDGKETMRLIPWHSNLVVDVQHTIIMKKDVILFDPSEKLQEAYLSKLATGKASVPHAPAKVTPEEPQANTSDNVISFEKFRTFQKKANLHVVSANTDGPDAA